MRARDRDSGQRRIVAIRAEVIHDQASTFPEFRSTSLQEIPARSQRLKMILTCRILLLVSYSLFWGGLTFYTGFVVRISHDVLSNPMDGGLITQRVTTLLQMLGAVTCVLMFWNAMLVSVKSFRYGRPLLACSVVLAAAIVGLIIVHGHLDAVIDIEGGIVKDRDAFVISHRRYNQLTTVAWISSLLYLPVTVVAWHRIDSVSSDAKT